MIRLPAQQGFTSLMRSAQQGFTSSMHSAQQGFTLIELMVVIVIIGLMSSAVMLTMSDPRGRISDEADTFSGRVRAARDIAVIGASPIAVWVSPTAYGFEQRSDGRWISYDEKPLETISWSDGTQAEVAGGARTRIVFDPVGRTDQPLRFVLRREDRIVSVSVALDGRVTQQ